MNGSTPLPPLDALKAQAKRLRAGLATNGTEINHAKSLELLARQYGYRDWNTIHAAVGNQPPSCPVSIGEHVQGQYLGQAFAGEVIGVQVLTQAGRYRVIFNFDEAVDVVTFEGFSNFRKRVSCVIDQRGVTAEKTSDGRPQLRLQM